MIDLIQQTPSDFQQLHARSRGACIRFKNQPMPPHCEPDRADVGIETRGDGSAALYVRYGVNYRGDIPEVRTWFQRGQHTFPDFDALVAWLQGPLLRAFQTQRPAQQPAAHPAPAQSPSQQRNGTPAARRGITDLAALRHQVQENQRVPVLNTQQVHEQLARRVRGQEPAIRALAEVAVRHTLRRHPKRPAVMFAVGPSGTGKTQSAQTLAEILASTHEEASGYHFLRLDMTEYQESSRVSQLLGAPQGYIGHDEGSQLLDTLDEHPKTIILFDEIEKAHPAILRVLMNAMDAGRLSRPGKGANGHEVNCRQAIFIFTSNLDAGAILRDLEERSGLGNPALEDEVCRKRLHAAGIAPEIVGRISRFLVFKPLSEETRAEIMAIAIIEVAQEYGVRIDYVEPSAILALMEKTPNQAFGIRPAQHRIDEQLGNLFADLVARGGTCRYRLAGPPFQCVPEVTDADAESPADPAAEPDTDSDPNARTPLSEEERERIWAEIDQMAESNERRPS